MKKLIHEVHRRSLWQVTGIFCAAAWVVLQVVDQLAEIAALPEWVPTFAFVLLLIGFPIVVATAFVQEGTPGSTTSPTSADGAAPEPEFTESGGIVEAGAPQPATRHRLFTWRNAIAGGVIAFALLGLVTVGWIVARSAGIGPAGTLVAKGVLDERATILVAEFASPDSLLGRAATEAFSIDFADSKVVRVAEPSTVKAGMARMELSPATTLDEDLALQLAEREGIPAVVVGEITPAGSGYVLSARMISVKDGSVLARQRQTAAGEDEIIDAIDGLSKGMRERVGDDLLDIGASAPLAQVTTGDLEALRLYSQGSALRRIEGPSDRVEALMLEAIERDSAFAMAWRGLAIVYQNRGQEPALVVESLTRTMDFQDRLTKRERHLARASYFSYVTYEFDRAILEYEALLDMDPRDPTALNNLAVDYTELRDFERAEEFFAKAFASDSTLVGLGNLVEIRAGLGRFDEAWDDLARMREMYPDPVTVDWYSAHVAAMQERLDEAIRYMESAMDRATGSLTGTAIGNADLAVFAALKGELGRSAAYLAEAKRANVEREASFNYYTGVLQEAWVAAAIRDDPTGAIALVREARERFPLQALAPLDRPYLQLAELYAFAGEPGPARAMLEAFDAAVSEELHPRFTSPYLRARAEIALAEGRTDEALRLYRESDTGYCVICALPGLARAQEASGDLAGALDTWQQYVDTPWLWRTFGNQHQQGPRLGPSLETLARMYDEQGDAENAAVYYARFVDLWADADPELQPRVLEAQARLEEIVRERG